MARKTYTEEDRTRVRQALLDAGRATAAREGLHALHLAELTASVGISKPYFYTFFDSLEDFCLQMMEDQRRGLEALLAQELAREDGTWEERVERFLRIILAHRENGIIVMTQQEEAALHNCLEPARFRAFRPGQREFFRRLLKLLDVSESDCPPEVLANMVFSCVLIHNSAAQSMPFFFPDYLDAASELHIRFLARYLSDLRCSQESRV